MNVSTEEKIITAHIEDQSEVTLREIERTGSAIRGAIFAIVFELGMVALIVAAYWISRWL